MDDQQGNVIDGTERARQWRRSRSKAAPENPGDGQGRSDAPKSIAASLLVPADMLEATLVAAEEASAAKAPSRDEQGGGPARPPADTELNVNPFLLPDAAAPSAQAPPARARIRSSIRARGSRLTMAIGSGARSVLTWFGVRAHRWRRSEAHGPATLAGRDLRCGAHRDSGGRAATCFAGAIWASVWFPPCGEPVQAVTGSPSRYANRA